MGIVVCSCSTHTSSYSTSLVSVPFVQATSPRSCMGGVGGISASTPRPMIAVMSAHMSRVFSCIGGVCLRVFLVSSHHVPYFFRDTFL